MDKQKEDEIKDMVKEEIKSERILPDLEYDPKMSAKFWIIIGIIILLWGGVMFLIWDKYDEITKHPCSICSEKIGTNILCSTTMGIPISKEFDINGSVITKNGFNPGG